jgi:hypothetical protein
MLAVTERNFGEAQRYFRVKARLLGLPRLALYDQYAPIGAELPRAIFDRARQLVLKAFEVFSPDFAAAARQFFERRWIDAELRPGKQDGAFCASPSPLLHPYVLCNHTGNLRDVMTLAHELGHGVHGWMARAQTLCNYDTPLTTAETASVFGEFVVFDHLLSAESDPRVQLALLCGKIEDTCATVYRQAVLTRFEQAVFAHRPAGRFTADAVCRLWLDANRPYYGDAVEFTEAYRWGWSYIPHFIQSRFYCYSYVFGELLVLSLYRRYKEEGPAFVPKYLGLLKAGGSDSPGKLPGRWAWTSTIRPSGRRVRRAPARWWIGPRRWPPPSPNRRPRPAHDRTPDDGSDAFDAHRPSGRAGIRRGSPAVCACAPRRRAGIVTVGRRWPTRSALSSPGRHPVIKPAAGLYPTALDRDAARGHRLCAWQNAGRLVALGEVGLTTGR